MGGQTGSALRRYDIAIGYGVAGASAFLLVSLLLFTVPSGLFLDAVLVIYVLTPAAIGLAFGLVGLSREPLGPSESVVAAAVTMFLPILWALPGSVPVVLLANGVAVCLISLTSYGLPRLHRRSRATQGGLLAVKLRRVLVPAVAVTLLLAAVASGPLVLGQPSACDPSGNPVNPTSGMLLGYALPDVPPQVSWDVEYTNGSTLITHAGGDDVSAEALSVEVGRSSADWTLLTSDTDGTVTAGDTARFAHVERGRDIDIRWQPEDGDCTQLIGDVDV